MKPVALITGAAGLIGSYLARSAPRWVPGWEVRGVTRAEVDLTDRAQVERLWNHHRPSCSPLRGVEPHRSCEQDPRRLGDQCRRDPVLADARADVPFVFLSTDQVFDGARDATSRPMSFVRSTCGKTKAEAEQVVLGKSGPCSRAHRVDGGHVTDSGPEFRRRYDAGCGERQQAHALYGRVPLSNAGWCWCGRSGNLACSAGRVCITWEARTVIPLGDRRAAGGTVSKLRSAIQPGSVVGYRGPPGRRILSMRATRCRRSCRFCLPGLRQWLSDGSSVGADPGTIPIKNLDRSVGGERI